MNHKKRISWIALVLALATAGTITGCGGGSSAAPPAPIQTFTISPFAPTGINVAVNGAQMFTATLSGVPNPVVTWSLVFSNSSGNCSPACGTLNTTSGMPGPDPVTYMAPPTVPSNNSVTLVATAQGTTLIATAFITITGPVSQAPTITSPGNTFFTEGTMGSFTVTTTGSPTPTLSESGTLPNGVTFVDNGNGTGTLSGTPAAGTAVAGPYTIHFTANNSAGSVMQSFVLTVNTSATPDFTISASPSTIVGRQGGRATNSVVTVNQTNPGFTGTVALSASGLPANVGTVTFAPPTITGGFGSSNMTVIVSSTAPVFTSFTITVTGTSGAISHATTVLLQVDICVVTIPASQSVSQGSSTSYTYLISNINGSCGVPNGAMANLSATFSPGASGLSVTFNPTTITEPGSSTMTVTASNTASLGTFTIFIHTTSFCASPCIVILDDSASITVTAPNVAPTITSANSTTFTEGAAGTFTVTTTGSPKPSLSESGALPSGVTFVDNANGTGTLSGTPAAGTAAGSPYNLTFTASNGVSPNATQNFTVTIVAPPAACVLLGQYTFLFQGFDSGGNVAIAGTFFVDASGTVTGGAEDINRSAGVTPNLAITGGSCTSDVNNKGILTLTTSMTPPGTTTPTTTYHFTASSLSSFQRGRFIEFDDTTGTGTRGSGFLDHDPGVGGNINVSSLAAPQMLANVYTAPASVSTGTVTLTATSAFNPSISDSATITITTTAPGISVAVSPTMAKVVVNGGQQFIGFVNNDPTFKGVTWSLSGSNCTGAACGTLTNVTIGSVTYNAPASVPPGTVTLTATSAGNTSISNSAAITLTTSAPGLSVSVSPTTANVQTKGSQVFFATVSNDSSDMGVNWSLTQGGAACSPTTCGTISQMSTPALGGDHIIGLTGNLGTSRVATVGRFHVDSTCTTFSTMCTLSSGEADTTTLTGSTATLTGTISAADSTTGRGTATVTLTATAIPQTFNFIYYLTTSGEVVLVQSDPRSSTVPALSGVVRASGGTGFNKMSLNGSFVFALEGAPTAASTTSVDIGLLVSDGNGNLKTGSTLDENNGGSGLGTLGLPGTGTYSVAANGRTTLTATFGSVMKNWVAYLGVGGAGFGSNKSFIMDLPGTGDVSFGELAGQASVFPGFSNSSLNSSLLPPFHDFRVNSAAPMIMGSHNESGLGSADGKGNTATSFSLAVDISDTTGTSSPPSFMGTYLVAPNGRLLVPMPATAPTLVCWIITPSPTSAGGQPQGDFACISSVTDTAPALLEFLQGRDF